MESDQHAFARLVEALDALVAREAVQISEGDYEGLLQTSQRTSPVVARLAEIGLKAADARSRAWIQTLIARRARNQELLGQRIATVRESLSRVSESRRRISLVAPSYGSTGPARARHLSSVG